MLEKLAGDNQIFGMRLWLRTGWMAYRDSKPDFEEKIGYVLGFQPADFVLPMRQPSGDESR